MGGGIAVKEILRHEADLHVPPGLFPDLAYDGLLRRFAELDPAADGIEVIGVWVAGHQKFAVF